MKPAVLVIEKFILEPDKLLSSILIDTVWDRRMHIRLTASFGVPYNYSNMSYPETPMPAALLAVCDLIRQQLGFTPNNCLINCYMDGKSTIGFHADSLVGLAPGTGVAVVSLGDVRTLTFRRTQEKSVRFGFPLPHGSVLYMPAEVQGEWQHAVLKQPDAGQRVSLTLRKVETPRDIDPNHFGKA